ncbi:hypothetical protein DEO72_LG3g1017 [Vigna unguiculata]|uniref:Uncharacterized protein n=1 Tax=Vigna unguiculata TaxID=3917 RepID=A0A4D6LDZ3_VIGUN|nr:hypothetical protein DEO72_LG3g1017 [Vigna unguiculata]
MASVAMAQLPQPPSLPLTSVDLIATTMVFEEHKPNNSDVRVLVQDKKMQSGMVL